MLAKIDVEIYEDEKHDSKKRLQVVFLSNEVGEKIFDATRNANPFIVNY